MSQQSPVVRLSQSSPVQLSQLSQILSGSQNTSQSMSQGSSYLQSQETDDSGDEVEVTAEPDPLEKTLQETSNWMSPHFQLSIEATISEKTNGIVCTCSNSRCIRLYCQCFAAGRLCGKLCTCSNCLNTSTAGPERMSAIIKVLDTKADAFCAVPSEMVTICYCRNSRCIKKYCDCFNSNKHCTSECMCKRCKNKPRKNKSKKRKRSQNREYSLHEYSAFATPQLVKKTMMSTDTKPSALRKDYKDDDEKQNAASHSAHSHTMQMLRDDMHRAAASIDPDAAAERVAAVIGTCASAVRAYAVKANAVAASPDE